MLLKTIAHYFASSKLRKEEAYTQSLVREYEQKSIQMQTRVHNQRVEYEQKIQIHQEKRNLELKEYLDFINSQMSLISEYVSQLKRFQTLFFPCLDSWFQLDLCKKEIKCASQQIKTIQATINLIDIYIREIQSLQQHNKRKKWQRIISQRVIFESKFITDTQWSIANSIKTENSAFSNEIRRLRSQKDTLLKKRNELYTNLNSLKAAEENFKQNYLKTQKTLIQQYGLCWDYWNQIKDKFEQFYAYKPSDNNYLNQWIESCPNGGTLIEIKELIVNKNELIENAKNKALQLDEKFQEYKERVKQAHNTGNFSNFEKDKNERDKYFSKKNEAFNYLNTLKDARDTLYNRRNEIQGYINKIWEIRPNSIINDIEAMLKNDEELNSFKIFGIPSNNPKFKRALARKE